MRKSPGIELGLQARRLQVAGFVPRLLFPRPRDWGRRRRVAGRKAVLNLLIDHVLLLLIFRLIGLAGRLLARASFVAAHAMALSVELGRGNARSGSRVPRIRNIQCDGAAAAQRLGLRPSSDRSARMTGKIIPVLMA